MEDIKEKLRPLAEFVVSLTGFGTALHVNDVMPEFKKAFEMGVQSERERILAALPEKRTFHPNLHGGCVNCNYTSTGCTCGGFNAAVNVTHAIVNNEIERA